MQWSFTRGDGNKISPPEEFIDQANITDRNIYDDFENTWPECWENAADFLEWEKEYDSIVESVDDPPYHRWFVGGRLNASANCVDRHVKEGRGDESALEWIGLNGETKTYSYDSLLTEINEVAAMFRGLGVEEGDTVALYLPRIPELPISMLACARLGAPHVVVSAEYSEDILTSFMKETGATTIVTCNGPGNREPPSLAQKAKRCEKELAGDVTTVVVNSLSNRNTVDYGRDFAALREKHRGETVSPVLRGSDEPLFICYASGPSGEPVGMAHGTGDYLSYVAWTAYAVLDIKMGDAVWCPATIEWITGHSYAVYGPLVHGATTVFYEGAPASSDKHRPWEIIEDNEVTQFYSTPAAIRTFKDWGSKYPAAHDLSSLRLLGTVGQRIDPESWMWFYKNVGNEKCPIVDTWYQAETGGITISTLPGICDMKPGSVGKPLPGIDAAVVDADGSEVSCGESGYLVLTRPSPGFFRPVQVSDNTIGENWSDFSNVRENGVYYSEDGAVVDDDGYVTILGRLDEVINVGYDSKTRVHVSEIECIVENMDEVEEAIVIRGHHEIKGEAPYAFVVPAENKIADIRTRIAEKVGRDLAIYARPEEVYTVPELPRTGSGGVLRKVLEDLVNGERLGNTDLLQNPDILDQIAVEIQHQSSGIGLQ